MKFLVDAQLPRRLAIQLQAWGYDAIHTRSLTLGNRTSDEDINDRSLREQRIVITKDADFVTSFQLQLDFCTFAQERDQRYDQARNGLDGRRRRYQQSSLFRRW